MTAVSPLSVNQLTAKINRRSINHALADDTSTPATFIGQQRARSALDFGLGIQAPGYNLYVMGEQATGRFTLVKEYIERHVGKLETPDDWCYVNNFDDEREPVILRMAPGEAKQFSKDVGHLISELLDTFPAAFDNPGYQRKKASLEREFEHKYDSAIDALERYAQAQGVALHEEEGTISFSPILNGKPVTDVEFAKLDEATQDNFYQLIDELENRLSESLLALPAWKRETSEKIRTLNRTTAEQGIKPLLKALEHKYSSDLGVLKYFRQMRPHLVDAIVSLISEDAKDEKMDEGDRKALFVENFLPNVIVGRDHNDGAPVVYEPNPTYQNLFGKIEYSSLHGSVYTNYRMIRPGALHKANGGYLLLDVDQVLEQPYVWEALKQALKFGQLKMDLPQQDVGMVNAITLSPQVINLNCKVLLLGSRDLYYTLQEYDDEFTENFRVLVDFDPEIPMEKQTLTDFVGRVRQQVIDLGLAGISPDAVTRLVEYSLRNAEHQERFSAHFSEVIELIQEAIFFASQEASLTLELKHLTHALSAKKVRTGRVSQALLDDIKEGHVLIATDGEAIGKVNGLTVLEVGDTTFGTPARITSTVYAGANGVVDIEREVELGQPIHSKGVMLLTGYLGHKYAQHFPLTLSANIALEQSYGHVDGDSASLGELVALISALTEIPANQSLAITGSINQYGEVQAVGGVNEKIEGFFDLCAHRGLTGQQGVIIPHSNEINLVLDKRVVEAAKKGRFTIYSVKTVDEALALLMNKEAGDISPKGRYPKNTINYHTVNRLYNIAMIVNGDDGE